MGFVVWVTGLPGSGKTAVAKELIKCFKNEGMKISYIPLDEIRRMIFPQPRYSEEEREVVYRAYVLIGKMLSENGINVLLDATAHRRRWRVLAGKNIKNFFEIYVKCPLEICIERETRRRQSAVRSMMYRDALLRMKSGRKAKGLGLVPGVDVPYEEPLYPEAVVDSDRCTAAECAAKIFETLRTSFRSSVSSRK